MLNPIPYATPVVPITADLRRGMLITFGVVSIMIGTGMGCVGLGLAAVFFMFSLGGGPPPGRVEFPLLLFLAGYLGVLTLFLWVGIDSIRCKRWVRPVVIALAWVAVSSAGLMIVFSSIGLASVPVNSRRPPPGMTAAAAAKLPATAPAYVTGPRVGDLAAAICWLALLGIGAPALFIAAYSSAGVRRTLEALDRRAGPSWSERCPQRVLTACAALLIGGLATGAASGAASVPWFGSYLRGPAATGLALLTGAGLIAAAVLMYLGQRAGWWLATVIIVGGFASAIASLLNLGVIEFYRQGGASEFELDQAAMSPVWSGPAPVVLAVATGVLCAGYLLWIRPSVGRVEEHRL